MKGLIVSFEKTFTLYKQPDKIGDIIEYENEEYLIIGIEKARFTSSKKLKVRYTSQNLNIKHEMQPKLSGTENKVTEFYVEIDTGKRLSKEGWWSNNQLSNDILRIGEVFEHKDYYYRMIAYTDIEFDFITLRASGLAESVFPVSVQEAKKTLVNHQKEKLDISVIK